jgi:hypothetical protein
MLDERQTLMAPRLDAWLCVRGFMLSAFALR